MDYLQDFYFSKFSIVGHSGDFFTVPAGEEWSMPMGIFAQNKFYYIKEGSCKFIIKDKEYDGIPGRMFFIPAGMPHSYSNDVEKQFSAYWIFFDIYPNNTSIFNLMNLPVFVDATNDYVTQYLFDCFIETNKGERVADKLHVKSCMLEMISQYMVIAKCDDMSVKGTKNETLNRVIEFIDDNIEANLSNDELAKLSHLHPNHFIRFFKKKTGMTPARYIKMRKMETAKQLIEETELSFNEIMHRVGCVDAAHFSKMFKSIYGSSPRAYRQNIRNVVVR